ncbi:hypothetical protein evm_012343 [Chilo suppressalis]|nr:hypothetical protein evm_012343 [Chilo suppressalis]
MYFATKVSPKTLLFFTVFIPWAISNVGMAATKIRSSEIIRRATKEEDTAGAGAAIRADSFSETSEKKDKKDDSSRADSQSSADDDNNNSAPIRYETKIRSTKGLKPAEFEPEENAGLHGRYENDDDSDDEAASSVNKPTLCDRQPACPAWRLWAKPSCTRNTSHGPQVPGSPAITGHGGDHGNGGARGVKNLRATGGHHKRLTLATYNGRTLRLDSHLAQLEVELGKIRWHILGLREVRREGEDTITLESGHLMYFRGGDQQSQGGIGFLVNKSLADNVVEMSSVSNRVVYLIIKLTERYSLKVVQVYAPTLTHSDDEVEDMFDDISRALHSTTKTHYNVVMGDFNTKVGVQNCSESVVGSHGFGSRNHRGQMLVNF